MKNVLFYTVILMWSLCVVSYSEAFVGASGVHRLYADGFVATGGTMITGAAWLSGMMSHGTVRVMRSSLYSAVPNVFVREGDVLPLALDIVGPESGIHTEDSIVMIEGAVNQAGVTVTINAVAVPLVEKQFSYAYSLVFDENIITIRAEKEGMVIEKNIIVYRDVGDIATAEDMLMRVARNFGKLYDLEATLVSQDMYNNIALVGTIWSKIYFKSPGAVRLESYTDESRQEEYSTFVLNDTMLYNTDEEGIVRETDLCVFADLGQDEFEQVNIPFDVDAFIAGHELVFETFDPSLQTGWLTAVPRTFSDLYSKVRLQINCTEGIIRIMELFVNDILAERNEVVDVVTVDGVVVPKTIRKTTFLPLGNYISDYVFENITVNQGLSDSLFFLS